MTKVTLYYSFAKVRHNNNYLQPFFTANLESGIYINIMYIKIMIRLESHR